MKKVGFRRKDMNEGKKLLRVLGEACGTGSKRMKEAMV
jgi:hypothetical protein